MACICVTKEIGNLLNIQLMTTHILKLKRLMKLNFHYLKQRLNKSIWRTRQRMQLIRLVLTLYVKTFRKYPTITLLVTVLTLLNLTIILLYLGLTTMGTFVIWIGFNLIGLLRKPKYVN